MLERIKVYCSIINCGDGSARNRWFLTMNQAETDQENQRDSWGESCTGMVETFVGSNIHVAAVSNAEEYFDENGDWRRDN